MPFLAGLLDEIEALHPGLETARATNELVRRVITRFVEGVIVESQARLAALAPADADAVRRAGRPVIAFPAAITRADAEIKAFLYPSRRSAATRRRWCATSSRASGPIPA